MIWHQKIVVFVTIISIIINIIIIIIIIITIKILTGVVFLLIFLEYLQTQLEPIALKYVIIYHIYGVVIVPFYH